MILQMRNKHNTFCDNEMNKGQTSRKDFNLETKFVDKL